MLNHDINKNWETEELDNQTCIRFALINLIRKSDNKIVFVNSARTMDNNIILHLPVWSS